MGYEIELSERDPQKVAVVRGQVGFPAIAPFLGAAFGEVMEVLGQEQITPVGPPFARYRLLKEGLDIAAGFPIDAEVKASGRVEPSELPGGPVAVTMHRGPYDTVREAYAAIQTWMKNQGYLEAGDPWESYLDAPSVAEPRTLVIFPCRLLQ